MAKIEDGCIEERWDTVHFGLCQTLYVTFFSFLYTEVMQTWIKLNI